MLQRAASNAYSWWWAGHIRTKQSKWLEQSLQDIEEKVEHVLRLLQEDGDSFAKRAEMYYKRRPELINFVEESYRAFRALAERYDHLSTELQNANNTLATCFPDQIDLAMDEDDEYGTPKPRLPPRGPAANAPMVPKAPIRELKRLITTASKQLQAKKLFERENSYKDVSKSGLTKEEAVAEIEKLEKDILALQTMKEFVKSSYQSGLNKYWSMENQIMEKQQRVCKLQDEFDIEKVIEDEDARTLMAEAALKSCQETLAQLQEAQEKSDRDAKEEHEKVEDARQRLSSLRHEYLPDQSDEEKPSEKDDSVKTGDVTPISSLDLGEVIEEKQEMEQVQEKMKEQSDSSSAVSLTVTELAEKIDDLVNKVLSLETAVSSQAVLIDRLRSESGELHAQIRTLEDDKAMLTEGANDLRKRVKELEEKLNGVQDLNRNVENQNSNIRSHFAQAQSSLHNLSGKLNSTKPDEEVDNGLQEEKEKQKDFDASAYDQSREGKNPGKKTVTSVNPEPTEEVEAKTLTQSGINIENTEPNTETENWQKMLLNGVEDREKFLLKEYSTILRNYKDIRKKLNNTEKRERSNQFEVSTQIRELKSAIANRDEEIHLLRRKLNALQGSLGENKDVEEGNSSASNLSNTIKPEERTEDELLGEVNTYLTNKDDDIIFLLADQPDAISPLEEKLRMDIDSILDENLDFWLRFSAQYHQVQKFKTTVEDLQDEISKIREKRKQEESTASDGKSITLDTKSEARPIYKHLKEIQTQLTAWLKQSQSLKDESERRFSSLCNIQEKISKALRQSVEEEEIRFSSHQAAKFQGEVLNMKHENNKVRDELQTGVDHITSLQVEIERTLRKLNEEFGLSTDQSQLANRSKIPLRSFIFGAKPKKKNSIFSCIHPNKKYQVLRAGLNM